MFSDIKRLTAQMPYYVILMNSKRAYRFSCTFKCYMKKLCQQYSSSFMGKYYQIMCQLEMDQKWFDRVQRIYLKCKIKFAAV